MKILELERVKVVDHGVSMKDVTFGAAREMVGMDDNSESGTLFFVPSN